MIARLLDAPLLNVGPRHDSPVPLLLRLLLRHCLPVSCRLELLAWLELWLHLLRNRRILPDHGLRVGVLNRWKLRDNLPWNHLLRDRLVSWHSESCRGARNN